MNKYYKMLELDKIIKQIKAETFLIKAKEELDNIELYDDLSIIETLLNEVDEAVILIQRMGKNPIFFKESTDFDFLLTKARKNGVLQIEEIMEIGNLLDSVDANYIYLDRINNANISCTYISKIILELNKCDELNAEIKRIITPYMEIKDDATVNLKNIRKKINDYSKNIQTKLQEIINKNSSLLTQNVVSIRNDRFVISVRNDSKNTIKGIIHDQSASGETVFIEPLVINELNNKLNQEKENEKKEIQLILRTLTNDIALHYESLYTSFHKFIYLDIVYSKASYALKINANKPRINNKGYFNLKNCYHPLLNSQEAVKNNISLGQDYKGIVITGPNTGGKTVLLKTVGLLSLMVKMGMLVTADANSDVMIFDNVFSDIGDEQSIDQNLSTFSSHLKNVVDIIHNITPYSLVLLDELGSGTDPMEGASLAISIFDYIINKKSLIIATSHYSELKLYAYNAKDIINASVEFDEQTLKPTYKLLIGVPGMSNAIKIAKTLGLETEIIDNASNYIYKRNDNLNIMLDKLIKQSHYLDSQIKEVEKEKEEVSKAKKEMEINKRTANSEIEKMLFEASKQAQLKVTKAMDEVNNLIRELEELKTHAFKQHELAQLKFSKKEIEEKYVPQYVNLENEEIAINSTVYIPQYECYGIITKILKNDKYEVLVGNVIMKLDKKDMKLSEQKEKKKTFSPTAISIKEKASSTIDLRGTRYEEAKERIEKFIDDAVYANLTMITFIHGFGTGVIRKLVQETLKQNKNIASFRYGGDGEGGQGVTIATLK